jgi:hypothetical protein
VETCGQHTGPSGIINAVDTINPGDINILDTTV